MQSAKCKVQKVRSKRREAKGKRQKAQGKKGKTAEGRRRKRNYGAIAQRVSGASLRMIVSSRRGPVEISTTGTASSSSMRAT